MEVLSQDAKPRGIFDCHILVCHWIAAKRVRSSNSILFLPLQFREMNHNPLQALHAP